MAKSYINTFLEICNLCILRLLASSAICCWNTSTAARRARANFSFSSSTVRHTFHMFLQSYDHSSMYCHLPMTLLLLGKLPQSINSRELKPVQFRRGQIPMHMIYENNFLNRIDIFIHLFVTR